MQHSPIEILITSKTKEKLLINPDQIEPPIPDQTEPLIPEQCEPPVPE
jgi:hypothetical protein